MPSCPQRRRLLRYWRAHFAPGVEALELEESSDAIVATGVMVVHRDAGMIAFHDVAPFRVRYRIACDRSWRVRSVHATASHGPRLDLDADGAGRWRGVPRLEGAVDVDIAASGFTNTLTIRRLGLAPGASREERVTYVAVPSLTVEPVAQRYTRLDTTRYRYENLTTPYVNDIEVDSDGLVVDYPGILTRIWPRPERRLGVSAVVEHGGNVLAEPISGYVLNDESPSAAVARVVREAGGMLTEAAVPLDASDDTLVFHCRVASGAFPSTSSWVRRTDVPADVPAPVARLLALPTD